MSIQKINRQNKNYPEILKKIYDPPEQIYYQGLLKKQEYFPLGVVGTRKMSAYGREMTRFFVEKLSQSQATIISGLALGIDGLAHQIALENKARTIAVLGSGLKRIYPPQHQKLAQEIINSQGALISEYSPLTTPTQKTFPARNRIISGLSWGILVIEAPLKSGALITARTALDQGREVFVLPGRINDFNSQGCLEIIKKGATLVTDPQEIIDTFLHFLQTQIQISPQKNS
jgi:DNA processing protein